MAQSPRILNHESFSHFEQRFMKIQPNASPRFGRLNPHQLFAHLRTITEISIGESKIQADASNILTRTGLFRWLVIDVMPWPKGKLKAPPAIVPAPSASFEEERRAFLRAMKRFVELHAAYPGRIVHNPLLGPIPLKDWARMHAKHNRHHLEQFGIQ